MLQKYEIIKDAPQKKLKIREYAIIDKRLKNIGPGLLRDEDYALLHEETYESSNIQTAISSGLIDLVSVLRTPIFFPNAHNIAKIAESVVNLYASKTKKSTKLIFSDGNGNPMVD